jgi:uncharacterized membrane protein YhaH (DUF805 family)
MFAIFFPDRISRLSYLLRFAVALIVFVMVEFKALRLIENSYPRLINNPWVSLTLAIGLPLAFFAYFLIAILFPRFRDIGFPQWSLLLSLVPIIGQLMLLAAFIAPAGFWLSAITKESAPPRLPGTPREADSSPGQLHEDPY